MRQNPHNHQSGTLKPSIADINITNKMKILGECMDLAIVDHNRATLKTLKSYCVALGAWTINYANKKVLKISLPAKRRSWMNGIFSQIGNLNPPFDYSNA